MIIYIRTQRQLVLLLSPHSYSFLYISIRIDDDTTHWLAGFPYSTYNVNISVRIYRTVLCISPLAGGTILIVVPVQCSLWIHAALIGDDIEKKLTSRRWEMRKSYTHQSSQLYTLDETKHFYLKKKRRYEMKELVSLSSFRCCCAAVCIP